MRISTKISLFIFFLLGVLAVNTSVGLLQLSRVEHELKGVVNRDVVLTETITLIVQHQLEKAVLFERVLRVAEELAFEDTSPARKQYLLSYLTLVSSGFENLARLITENIANSTAVIKENLNETVLVQQAQDLKGIEGLIGDIGQAHQSYDASVKGIVTAVRADEYQLSFEDIEAIEREEGKLNKDVKLLLERVQSFAKKSLARAENVERVAARMLWISLTVSLLASIILVFLVIRSIVTPLKDLGAAARKVGDGDFNIQLNASSRDEIGEVSAAFNAMARQLLEARRELQQKNAMLAENLEITETQKKDLEKTNLALDTFVRTVSHDIRAPLTGIGGYAAFLEKYYENKMDEKSKSCISGIRKSAYRLNSLIEDLLTFARVSRAKNLAERIEVSGLLKATAQRLEPATQQSEATIKILDGMPVITCDPVKLGTVFFSLIDNAVKFSSKINGKRPEVTVGCSERGGYYEFFVRDNGIGIAPENHLRIFDIFKRLHNPSEYPGTGAGLSIVRGIVDDWDGKVWVESQSGEGATFYFTVPKTN